MSKPKAFVMAACWVASLTVNAQAAWATIGFAEWEIYTPGGDVILHADGWKEIYGDCLKADDSGTASPERSHVYVSHLRRWRYYKGYVAGESQTGFFLFNETSKQVTTYANEPALLQAIERHSLGEPTSNWLTSMDGWTEAWFPEMVWSPCKKLLSQPETQNASGELGSMSRTQCRQALSPETLSRYRERTWGRQCQQFKAAPLGQQQQQPDLKAFCDELLSIQPSRR